MKRNELPERNAHIVAMYEGGMSLRDVAHEFFLTFAGVDHILKQRGIPKRPPFAKVNWRKAAE